MTNKRLTSLLNKADLEFLKSTGAKELRLLRIYKKGLDDVLSEISKAFTGTENPTITQIRKFNRLTAIEKNITEKISSLTKQAISQTKISVTEQYRESFSSTAKIWKEIGVDITFTPMNEASISYVTEDNLWLDALKNKNAELLTNVKREFETVLRMNAREEVASGLMQGSSYSDVAKAIKGRFNVSATRAKMISFTEMHKGHSAGRVEGIKDGMDAAAELGIKVQKVWKHNGAGKEPRPSHVRANNQVADENGNFHVGGEVLEGPGLGSDPANNIYCHCSAQMEIVDL